MIHLGRRALLGGGIGLLGCEPTATATATATSNATATATATATSNATATATANPTATSTSNATGKAPVKPRQPILHAAYPALRALPFFDLAYTDTALLEAPTLARALGVGELWLKRDDLANDLFGGSKYRKLEWLLAAARQRGATDLVTFGGAGSNQAVATAAFGAAAGFRVKVMLAPQPPSYVVRVNLRACAHFGAEIVAIRGVADAEREALARAPKTTFVIPSGGSTPLGNLGFVEAAFQLRADRERKKIAPFDTIVIPLGTTGSAAGLAVGLRAAGEATRVLGFRASSEAASGPGRVEHAARELVRFVSELVPAFAGLEQTARVDVDGSALGRGYGVPTRAGDDVSRLVKEHVGLDLEPVYCAKAAAGLRHVATSLRRSRVLLWITQPAWPPTLEHIDEARMIPEPLRALL